MADPGKAGRPRKIREEEFCQCCGNRGYTHSVPSWAQGYKETGKNYYRRFRHDDRQFYCKTCNMEECYVEDILRKREEEQFPFLEPYCKQMIIEAESYAKDFCAIWEIYRQCSAQHQDMANQQGR